MKYLKYLFIISFICLFSQSCSDKMKLEQELRNQENIVTVKVISNTPGAPIKISGGTHSYLIIKNSWEETFKTKDPLVGMEASCSDYSVLITIEIYVNGELKVRGEDNGNIRVSFRIKE